MATQSLDILQQHWSRVREKQGIEVSRLYPDGYLLLREDPEAWIQLNPQDRLQRVRRLVLDLEDKDDVEEIGDSIGELTHLTHFSIEKARSLKYLPNVITRLHHMQVLKIYYCRNLQALPVSLGELSSLTHLSLIRCTNLQKLPASLGKLHRLTHLTLNNCINLQALPASLGELHSLTHLTLKYLINLHLLPASLGDLHSLTHLTLNFCINSQALPACLGELRSITHLSLSDCENLQALPACFGELHSLTHLTLSSCDNLRELPASLGGLHSLTHLTVSSCHNLRALPASLGELHSLTHLTLKFLTNLHLLPASLGNLHSLTHLTLRSCPNLRELASLGELHSLTHLSVNWCNLRELPASLGEFHSLTHLSLVICDNLRSLPASFGELHSLTHLSLSWCTNLQELPESLGELHSLTHLSLDSCDNLQALRASLGELHSLTHLSLSWCTNLQELPASLGELHSLTHLSLDTCDHLRELPSSLGELHSLTHLSLIRCTNLQKLPASLGKLQTLAEFTLCGCDAVKFIPNMKVETLHFGSCKDNHFPSFKNLSNFQTSILGVSQIPINSDGMPRLLFLDLQKSQIKHFSVLGNIKNLPKLEILSLPKCFRLETLPFDLNDSLIISVDETHVRKTWKDLKIEMMSSFSDSLTASGFQNPFNISPHECLLLNEDPIRNLILYEQVRLLELSICEDDDEKLTYIKEMSQLTHLYIEGNEDFSHYIDLKYLPNTITSLRHLSLRNCDYNFFSGWLNMLNNLKSLDLDFSDYEEPENIDVSVLVSLRCLTLRDGEITSLLNSMAKLSNLKTLVLYRCEFLESLPADMNLVKLKLIDTFIQPLPTGLRHLEMLYVFDSDGCDFYDGYLKELVNLETLSITCNDMNFLPSLEGLLNLQELQLKDCFSLRIMPNLGKLSKLCSLNISGTRIKTLPDCIINLHNLKHLILPKRFKKESLPHNFGKEPVVIIDDIHEVYYKNMGFHDSYYEISSEEDFEITLDSEEVIEEVVDEDVTRISQEGHNTVQTSLHQLQNLPGDHTLVLGGHHSQRRNDAICKDSQHALHSLQNQQSKVNNNQQSDDSKVTAQKKDILLQNIQSQMSKNITLEQAAKNLDVSKSTLKRRLKDFEIQWPRKNKKILKDAKTTKDDVEPSSRKCSSLFNLVNPINPRDQKLAVGINQLAALPNNVPFECPTTTQGNMNNTQQYQEHSDAVSPSEWLSTEPPNESSSTVVVKVTYSGHTGRINFCLTKSIDQLKEEVRNKLKLEDDNFLMEYEDEDQEWMIMNSISDLKHAALLHAKLSSGQNVVRLNIIPKIKSCYPTSMTTPMSQVIRCNIQSDNIHLRAGVGSSSTSLKSTAPNAPAINKMMTLDSFQYRNYLPAIMHPFLEGWLNVNADGNCGFRIVADAFHGGEDNWARARWTMYNELGSKTIYEKLYGGQQEVRGAMNRILWDSIENAPPEHWMTSIQDLFVIATLYNCVVIYFSFGAKSALHTTILPLRAFPDIQSPHGELAIAHCGTHHPHYIRVFLQKDAPLPPIANYWRKYRDPSVEGWAENYSTRLVFWEKTVDMKLKRL